MEEQRRHMLGLEKDGRDLLAGWINFQSSNSLVRNPFFFFLHYRALVSNELVMAKEIYTNYMFKTPYSNRD
jgi:hypothetical protein